MPQSVAWISKANHKNSERCFRFGLDLANIDAWKLDGGLSVWID